MPIEPDLALAAVLEGADDWRARRALRLAGEPAEPVPPPGQDLEGGLVGPSGRPSPGATGVALCHLGLLGWLGSGPAAVAADWLEAARTPAGAWLDAPGDVPGPIDGAAAGRVWATAAAVSGLLVSGRAPGARALALLGAEAGSDGSFSGGPAPTFAAAAAFWLAEGPRSERAQWALRWARTLDDDEVGPHGLALALVLWTAAGVPFEHPSAELFLERLCAQPPAEGFADHELTLVTLELLAAHELWRPPPP